MYTIRLLSLFSTFSVLSSLKIIRPTNFQVIKISENTEPGIIFSAVVENPTYDQLNYRLQQFGSNFYLDGKNLMTAREFDYEVTGDRMHDLTLEVSDSYTTVECSFQIQVTNINDNKPVLSGSFRGYVKEEQPVGESVIFKSLSAVDDDADDELRYSLSGDDSNKFSISKSVIDIQTSAKFDRDIDKKYYDKLLLTVTDLANHTDSNRLNITIIDINDNAPKCTPDTYMVEINEDVSIGSDAISIKCQDMDEGRNGYISMHFQSTASSDKFEIRPDGRIKIKSILDYESLENFNSFLKLTVFVKDNPRDSKDSLTSTVTVNVKILPVNEYSPTWVEFLPASLNNVYYVSENAVIGTVILTVKAEDQDRGPNCFIIYRLVSNSESSAKFRLDSITGELSTKSFLDRDVKSGGRHSYKLQVEAIDNEGETSGVSQLTINLLEYNDNAPTFSKSVYGVTIKESMPVGGNVVLLSADDIDESTNLSLYIVDGDKNKFGFHSSVSGQIILSKSIELDGLRPDPSLYSLKVIVKDGDTNEKTGSCRVLISVESANDNTPAFEKTKTIMIPEDHPVGDSVIILTAKDLDSGKDGEIIYSIIGGDPTKTFSINSNTGEIHLVKPLDFETMSDPVFYLNVSAQDRGTPMKSSNTIQQIDIENVNDNLPICSSTFIKEYINDNATAGYKITRLKCTDRDKIRALTCYINGKNKDLFSMNTDGDLLLKRGVDYDSGPSHFSAEITVTDGKHRILVFLMLVLLPTNDARPVILPASDNVTLKENLPPGTTVTHVTATDADAAPHNIVKYQLLGASNKFGIDRSSGEIRLLSYLDYEVQTSYQLKVVVTDGGGLKVT
ncbi:cadherin EGF LAG seven-pass G-type receptor 1-like [Octopus bimaculoides]|uniref:cadherin EGF LAG seven-pass G-type receptor 1-like n=1 Tax=Octopus bimaculoides TaxID=37653 RepID=UPI0022E6ECF1|nr:cadherin EGF LAG seven-pass G-type receptor 1-like [Octopus bimaculoides]